MNNSQTNPRRGVAVLMVLLLISVVLGLSYAVVRSQYTARQIQQNSGRSSSARQAAATGLMMAIKKMHQGDDWNGVDTTLTGSLGDYESFQVTYTTGDALLASDDPDYEDWPYRVTLLSTGMAVDPDNPQCVATHQIQAVVQLIPRALADEPDEWDEMISYTFYQWKDGQFQINVPFRIEGPVRIQDDLELAKSYPWSNSARNRYLADLNSMRLNGFTDWRPFDGPIDLPYDKQPGGLISLYNTSMAVATNDLPRDDADDWSHPGEMLTYRLYPGGKTYSVQTIGGVQDNVTLEPDPTTNPLGIFYRSGKIQLYNNVTIRGMLISRGGHGSDIEFCGVNIELLPHNLPALEGTDKPVRLPTVLSADDVSFWCNSESTVTGLLTANDDFEVGWDNQDDISLDISGLVIAKDIKIRGRNDWYQNSGWWEDQYDDFDDQEDEEDAIPYFPVWLQAEEGLDPAPQLTVKPDPDDVRYHWPNANSPIYVPHGDDDGLRWTLLRWTENP